MLRVTRSQTRTTIYQVRVPLIWSTSKKCFEMDTTRINLAPTDKIQPAPHDLHLEANGEGGFQLTIGAEVEHED